MLRWAPAAALIGVLVWVIVSRWDPSALSAIRLRPAQLILAIAALLSYRFMSHAVWYWILRRMGGGLSFRDSQAVCFLTSLAKFIPGKIWIAVGRGSLAARAGAPWHAAAAATLIEMGMLVVAGSGIAALFLLTLSTPGEAALGLGPLGWLAVALGGVLVSPPVFRRAVRLVFRREIPGSWCWSDAVKAGAMYAGLWLFHGCVYFLLLSAVMDIPLSSLPVVIGAAAAATTLGFVAVFSPGGIGVREGVLGLLLSGVVPLSLSLAAVLAIRILLLIEQVATTTIAALTHPHLLHTGRARNGPDSSRERAFG